MGLQNWFYIVGIIFMVLYGVALVFISIVFYRLYQNLNTLQEKIVHRFEQVVDPAEAAIATGAKVAKSAARKLKKMVDGN